MLTTVAGGGGRRSWLPVLCSMILLLGIVLAGFSAASPARAADQQVNGKSVDEFDDEYADD